MDRISNLIDNLTVNVYREELDEPVSVTEDGEIATLRDLIVSNASEDTRAAFREVFGEIMDVQPGKIIPIQKLDTQGLQRVTVEILQRMDPTHRISIATQGDFGKDQLIEEVRKNSLVGTRMMKTSVTGGLYMQQVVEANKVKPMTGPRPPFQSPKFDF